MFPETAVVTGATGGIGRAIVAALEGQGTAVRGLDLVDGFDVSDPEVWEDVEPADLVCLNAGVLSSGDGSLEDYRRILGVNVDGVVFGVQALAPKLRDGSAFVVTAYRIYHSADRAAAVEQSCRAFNDFDTLDRQRIDRFGMIAGLRCKRADVDAVG